MLHINVFFGETCNEKRSVIMGVITDKIFIIIYNISSKYQIFKYNFFPYSFVMSPRMRNKHAFSYFLYSFHIGTRTLSILGNASESSTH